MRRLYFALLIVWIGCSPKTLGYFEVDPYFKPVANPIDEPLYIYLGNDVKDDMVLQKMGMRTLRVHDFRQSIQFALSKTLDNQFRAVEPFADDKKNFVLKVFRLEPIWWMGEKKQEPKPVPPPVLTSPMESEPLPPSVLPLSANKTDSVIHEFGCLVKYDAVLYYGGEKVAEASGETLVIGYQNELYTIEQLLKESVKRSCEELAKKLSDKK